MSTTINYIDVTKNPQFSQLFFKSCYAFALDVLKNFKDTMTYDEFSNNVRYSFLMICKNVKNLDEFKWLLDNSNVTINEQIEERHAQNVGQSVLSYASQNINTKDILQYCLDNMGSFDINLLFPATYNVGDPFTMICGYQIPENKLEMCLMLIKKGANYKNAYVPALKWDCYDVLKYIVMQEDFNKNEKVKGSIQMSYEKLAQHWKKDKALQIINISKQIKELKSLFDSL